MKRIVSIFAALAMFVAVTCQGAALPKSFVVGASASEEPTFVVNSSDRTVTIALPFTEGQRSARDIADPATVSVCLSQMYVKADGSSWVLMSEKDYCGQGQTKVVNGMITRVFVIPQIGDGVNYSIRVWGRSGTQHLWINQSSQFSRLSENGSPAYEAVINLKTGEVTTVPGDHQVRQ